MIGALANLMQINELINCTEQQLFGRIAISGDGGITFKSHMLKIINEMVYDRRKLLHEINQ